MSKRLVVIDGKSIFYRGYYAMPHLTNSAGIPLGGVYGFTVLAFNVIKKLQPHYVCVAWDKAKTNIRSRKKLYPEYKAKRQTASEDFYAQIPILFKLLKAFNWPLYEFDDYEADDIMATLAKKARSQDLQTLLVSSDLDLLQALGKNTKIYALKKGIKNIEEFDEDSFLQKYKVPVQQFRDLKALMGDSSDNIPGVAGIGPKGATKLLLEYQDLDNIYKNLDTIEPKVAQKLKDHKEMAYLSRQLVTLMEDAPVDLDLKSMSIVNLDSFKLQKALRNLEFYSLLPQVPQAMQVIEQTNLVNGAQVKLRKPKVVMHKKVTDLKDIDWRTPVFVHAYCLKRFGKNPACLLVSDKKSILHIYELKESSTDLKINKAIIFGYNTKQIIQVLSDLGIKNIMVDHDVQIAAFLLNSLRRLQTLTSLADDKLGYASELDELELEDFISKAPEITAVIFKLKQLQEKELSKLPQLNKLTKDIEWPFIPVLARLEREGMALDILVLKKLKTQFLEQIKNLEQTIYDLAGETFNLASPLQLSKILYNKLKISVVGIRKNKSGYSTDAEALQRLSKNYPIVAYIMQWREFSKLQNTYIEGLLEHVQADGRVYSDMRLTATATGRLSSANPNLQNIPIKTQVGSLIRQAFVAPKGYKLISADYSQFELRLAAVLSKDKKLIDAFDKGLDIHIITASTVFDIPQSKVSKEQRYLAKAINFGVLYGQGPHGLSQLTGMSFMQAQEFITKYFEQRPRFKEYQDDIYKKTKKTGYVETLFGRRRLLPDINSSNNRLRQAAFRQAINMPIQGTEADLMKLAMIRLDKKLNQDCRQIMQVHDSIIVECPQSKVEKTAETMKQIMENVYPKLGIALKVDIVADDSWPIS